MPNDKVVVPVFHPESGEVHQIEFPHDLPIHEAHSALEDYYTESKPSQEGTVEYSPEFISQVSKAWDAAARGNNPLVEAGFSVGKDGKASPLEINRAAYGQIPTDKIHTTSDALGVVHTHPDARAGSVSNPASPQDIEAAKKFKKHVWIVDLNGLHDITPDGQLVNIYRSIPKAEKK